MALQTVGELLSKAAALFTTAGLADPGIEAEFLLAHFLETSGRAPGPETGTG